MNNVNPNPISQQNKFQDLPEDIKEAMTSVDSAKVIKEISDKHRLHIDQGGALADEAGKLMLGETPPSEFVTRLKTSVRVEEKVAHEIAEEVNARIFRPIRESLKEMYNMDGKLLKKEVPAVDLEQKMSIGSTDETPVEPTQSGMVKATTDSYRENIEDDDVF